MIQVGASPIEMDAKDKVPVVADDVGLKCVFRIANECFTTER